MAKGQVFKPGNTVILDFSTGGTVRWEVLKHLRTGFVWIRRIGTRQKVHSSRLHFTGSSHDKIDDRKD